MTKPLPPDELARRRKTHKPPGQKPKRRGGAVGPVSGKQMIESAERQARAVQLRVAGASLQQIADTVGFANPSGAHAAIMRALREMLPEQERADARRLEIAKLDRLEMAAWPRAMGAGEDADRAAGTILRCISMRAKILGLEAPAALDVRVREGDLVHVEILEVLNEHALEALRPFQDEMVRLSRQRAGQRVIDVEAT
jgi:AraC-like DNA-binding protein